MVITKATNGIAMFDCGNILISNNDISYNRQKGILSMRSDNNVITGNKLSRHKRSGIQMWYSSNNVFSNNEVNNNGFMGVENIHGSSSNEISENRVTNNKQGISLYGDCRNCDIRANYLDSNGQGITIESNARQNEIIENHIIRSTGVGCSIGSGTGNNLVHSNYFFENSQNAADESTFGANQWDNGLMGNFWDDYLGIDFDEDGIGDSPYNISGAAGSQDRFPLMEMLPDFAVVLEDFIFTIGVGEIQIDAGIKNVGFSYIGGLVVSILEERLDGSIVQLASFQFQDLVRNAKAYMSVLWIPTKYHKVKVVIDPQDVIREYHESNNIAEKTYTGNPPTIVQVYSEFGSWNGDIVGTFLAGVNFENVFTAVVEDLDGVDDIEQVIFELNGNPVNGIDGPGNTWYREINIADLHQGANILKIRAYDKGGNFAERIITIGAIQLPFWLQEVIISVGYKWVKVGFNFATRSLFVEFEYPYEGVDETNFNKPIPSKVPFIGGTGNVYNLSVTFRFEFSFLTKKVYLTLTGKFSAKVFGIAVKGSISGETKINPVTLDIERAKLTITLELSYTPFQHRTKAKSVTINCGVTGSVYFSIEVIYYSIGRGIDYSSFEIVTKLSVCGWLKVGVDLGWVGGSLSLKIGGHGTLTILIEDGFEMHLDIGFYLRWNIKWKFLWFRGSFGGGTDWNYRVFSPEEFSGNSTESGWSFADNNTEPIDARPRVATDHNGNAMMVWTQNKTVDDKPTTDIYYSIWQGDDWGPAEYVTNDDYSDSDPALTYFANGKVMLVWSRVMGDTSTMTVEKPFEILKTQEIAYSIWDGSSWSTPELITNDDSANGRAVVSASPSGEVIAAWVGDPDYNFTTTTDMEIFYSTWNGGSWTPKTALTNNDNMDYDISLAHDSEGNAILSWIRDVDGNRSTTDDIEIRFTQREQDSWTDSGLVHISEEDKESPSIVFDHNDNALITWVGRTDNMSRLYFATLDKVSGVWSEPEIVHEEPFFIYTPAINVDPDNNAVIVWRGFEDDEQERNYYLTHNTTETYFDGEICYAIKDLSRPEAVWSEVKYLTSDNKTDWMASAVIIRGHSNDLLLVWEKVENVRKIIRELKPDLAITSSDITFSNQHPTEGELIDITANIHNIGDVKVENLEVSLYDGDPDNGGVLIGTSIIPFLDYNSNELVSIAWLAEAGLNQIYVVIDPNDLIQEFDEVNNQAHNEITIIPDLSIIAEDINPSDPLPEEGQIIAIGAIIYNDGGTIAQDVLVEFYSDNYLFYSVIIPSIAENGFVTISADWLVLAGNNNISVVVDPDKQIMEWNEYNNEAWKILTISADLEISREAITLSSTSLNLGETLTIEATIRNIGYANADNVLVELFDGNPYENGILVESRFVDLAIGETNICSFDWIPPLGGHKVFIIIDREDAVFESDELNNIAYKEIVVTALPDLTISEYCFVRSPDFNAININVENLGVIGASGITIDVYDGDPAIAGEILVSRLILHIGAGESEFLEIELTDLPESDFIYLVVDPDNLIQESDEENNQLIIDYSMIPITVAGSDQSVVEGDLVQFIGSLSLGDPLDYSFFWEFGDGETADVIDPTHSYGDNGEYLVTLQVTGAHYIGFDYVLISVSNANPSVEAGTNFEINEGDEIAFEGSFSDPGSLDSHTILWDFGDGDTASDTLNPSHIYEDNGIYTVKLSVPTPPSSSVTVRETV
ncbi:MAG: CARDB domain-containing protein [Candidatus Thorarchaeota archaeon]